MLRTAQSALDPIAFRRARHVITENTRTLEAAEALIAGDRKRLGALMAESHASMRDDFEITLPKIDLLVSVLQQTIGGEGGARMTGGGFGGCCVALMPAEMLTDVRAAVLQDYQTPDGMPPQLIEARPCGGAERVS